MKKVLPVLFIFLLQAITVFAQNIPIAEPPKEVADNFKNSYSEASYIEWQKEGENYSVTFEVSNHQSVHIVYDESGEVREKYMALPTKDVPKNIANYLSTAHSNSSVNRYWVKQKGGERIYKVQLDGIVVVGYGTLAGSSYGVSSSGITAEEQDTTAVASAENVQEETGAEFVYFNKYGNNIAKEDAVVGNQGLQRNDKQMAVYKKTNKFKRLRGNKPGR